MARILVVEDDPSIADLVALYLRHDGHEVVRSGHGLEALRRLESAPDDFELVVLDLMLPGLDGRGLCRRLRQISQVPVIMLTALDDDRDKIEGLELGADDYLTKPFNPNELVARIHAILRRVGRAAPATEPAERRARRALGRATLDLDARRLQIEDEDVPLRTKEFDLLAALADRPGIVLTRDHLLERVWGGEFAGDTRTVDVHVSRLREKLATARSGIEIETVRSVGYRLVIRG
jgi:two-component system alkaline phosphatase synthesis response regulator PhoP/two-component system response regulator MtrA